MNYNEFEKVHSNLYQIEFANIKDSGNDILGDINIANRYFRLFGTGTTPNGCWVINPKMIELEDIDTTSGKDVYGPEILINDITGTVSSCNQYIKY